MKIDHATVIARNVNWFLRSGIMRPADGFWGVAERLVVLDGNDALGKIDETFWFQTTVAPGIIALEHRRPDCNFETVLMLDRAAGVLDRPDLKAVADNIIEFLFRRSSLFHRMNKEDDHYGLWEWAQPYRMHSYWTDDIAWNITVLLILAKEGREELKEAGVLTARTLRSHVLAYLTHVNTVGYHKPYGDGKIAGYSMNPHWMGLVTMAFAHAQVADPATDYAGVINEYYDRFALAGPPAFDERSQKAARELPWALSEYAYLTITAPICADALQSTKIGDVARQAADLLIERQAPEGNFPSEHYEAPSASHLADLIYTQNWATLGLCHVSRLFAGERKYREAFERSLVFLEKIQDRSDNVHLDGCWRGMYDTTAQAWGGGNAYEGGANSIYSGWTNAPIALAFLFDVSGDSLFVPRIVNPGRE